ncbi:MAG: hypothetical protein ABSE73_28355, partial [Planctomycetota bacterium]
LLFERKHAVQRCDLEVAKLTEVQQAREKTLKNLQQLLAVDAALRSDVVSAETEARIALKNVEQARLGLEQAKAAEQHVMVNAAKDDAGFEATRLALKVQQTKLKQAQEQRNAAELEARKTELETAKKQASAELAAAQSAVERARPKAQPVELHAEEDGIVRSDPLNENTVAPDGSILLLVSALRDPWVEAYVDPAFAPDIQRNPPVTIFPPDDSAPITASVKFEHGTVVSVPAALHDLMPRLQRALSFNIELPANTTLLPGAAVRITIKRTLRE